MFDDFVQNSRESGVAANSLAPGAEMHDGFEPDDGQIAVTALETGYVSAQDASLALQPIFQLGRVQYSFPAPLALLTVSSNILTMCLFAYPDPLSLAATPPAAPPSAPPRLVRINLDDPERTEEAEIPLPPAPRSRHAAPTQDPMLQGPHKMFADPTGRHLLISMRSGDNYYWTSGWKRARPLPRLKTLVVESVAWNRLASDGSGVPAPPVNKRASTAGTPLVSTREILLGTQTGDIYEALLSTPASGTGEEGDFLDRLARRTGAGSANAEVDRAFSHVYTLPERQPVTGLTAEVYPSGAGGGGGAGAKMAVIATTSTRIYEFVGTAGKPKNEQGDGEGMYGSVFEPYRGDASPNLKSELPGDLPYSELHTWSPPDRRTSKALAWLTGPGVYHGFLAFNAQQSVGESVIDSANLLPYPAIAFDDDEDGGGGGEPVAEIPLSIALTEFHFVLVYRDRVMGISSLDDRIVFEEVLPLRPHERVIGTAVDTARRTYWVYTDASIFELVVRAEDRDVWSVYLQRGAHDAALQHAKTNAQRDVVLASQGDRYFRDGRYIQAAQCYAQTFTRTFEDIVLRFVDQGEHDALRYYLVMRLERLAKADVTQRVMLATWLVEIYLAKINQLDDAAAAEADSEGEGVGNYTVEKDMLEEELRQFLVTYKDNLDRKTTFGLLVRHGRTSLLMHYASVIGDHERIVRHWVQVEEWDRAVEAVTASGALELYYRFSLVLMRHAPKQTVTAWTRQEALEPQRLIPAMLQHRPKRGEPNEAVRYLLHVTQKQGNAAAAVHNFLVTLLARSDDDDAARTLLTFVDDSPTHPLTGQPLYDLDYALRVCASNGRVEACVRIYAKMGLYESAVELALGEEGTDGAIVRTAGGATDGKADAQAVAAGPDIELACRIAEMVEGDEVLKKKLWLRVAKLVVQSAADPKVAMEFLERTPLLSIEDVLPFFPDFTLIDSFKASICDSLESYAARIEALKLEMDGATQSADTIRADVARLAGRFVSVEAAQKCNACGGALLRRQFYVFPCRHAFHADCLVRHATRHLLPQRALRRILVLQEQLSELTAGAVPPLPPSYAHAVAEGAVGAAVTGLDRLREFVLPDAVVGAIASGVAVSVKGGRRVLAPLDPFAEPARSAGAKLKGGATPAANGAAGATEKVDTAGGAETPPRINGALAARSGGGGVDDETASRIEALRDELDGLVASSCCICEGALSALGRGFVGVGASAGVGGGAMGKAEREREREEIEEWAL